MGIASKIFDDSESLSPDVKKRLEEMKETAGGVFDSISAEDASLNKDLHNFGGQGYLSGKVPFARMWTAVRVTRPTDETEEITVDENLSPSNFDFENFSYEFPKSTSPTAEDVKITGTKLEKFPTDGFKVYTLGMHNTQERQVFAPQQDDSDITILGKTILPSQRTSYTDSAYMSPEGTAGERKNLRPPAGITSISSTTQNAAGPVAGILKTTINFTVYDFEEFDMIYSKYFMRPAARVFIDFGWTDVEGFQLYDPQEYIKDPQNFNELIYGENGQLQQSKYGMQFIQGQVVNFESSLDSATGAFKCVISVTSKNMQLFDVDMNDDLIGNVKENMLANIEYRILQLAENALFPNNKDTLESSNYSDDEVKEWNQTANIFAAEMLSSKTNNVPTQLNVELGIFWKGSFVKDKGDEKKKVPQTGEDALYLSYGFIEDVIFNAELGKYSSVANQFVDTEAIEFDSSNSTTMWNQDLYDRQKFLKQNTQLPFLFPDNWDDTYNTRKGKAVKNLTKELKAAGRIPIREVFIKLSVIKQAIKSADSMSEVFNYIFKKMGESTGYGWDWGLNTTTANATTLGIVDRNFLPRKVEGDEVEPDSFFDDMFVFEPFSENSLIKNMTFSLSQGDGSAISSKLALQSLGEAGRNIFPTSQIIDVAQTQMVLEDLQDDGTYKSIYNVEFFPPADALSDLEKIFTSLESTEPEIADPTYLSAQNVYGGEDTKFSVIPASSDAYINKSKELQTKKGDRGDLEPSAVPTKAFRENKATLENSDFEFSDNAYDFYTKKYFMFSVRTRPTILPMKLSLTLHGFTGLQPSNKFRINHIPTRYMNFVFFQVMRIAYTTSPGKFDTAVECVMRMRDDVKEKLPINTNVVNVLNPYMLKNSHKLDESEKILPFLSYMIPNLGIMEQINKTIESDSSNNNIDYAYTMKTLPTGKGNSNYLKKQIESAFVINSEEDKDSSGFTEFEEKLNSLTASNIEIKVDEIEEVSTFSIRYNFKSDTEYICLISGKKFLILEMGASTSKVPEYFELINGQFEKKEAEEA